MNKEGKEMFALTLDQAVKKELRKIDRYKKEFPGAEFVPVPLWLKHEIDCGRILRGK